MIRYLQGNVTNPVGKKPFLIPHIVNDAGRMGSGVAKALYTKWPLVRSCYIKWATDESKPSFQLGEIQCVPVELDILVVNMVAQHDTISVDNPQPIKYDALEKCMMTVNHILQRTYAVEDEHYTIHAPKFGSLRAGGDWNRIENMINTIWKQWTVTIYEYKE